MSFLETAFRRFSLAIFCAVLFLSANGARAACSFGAANYSAFAYANGWVDTNVIPNVFRPTFGPSEDPDQDKLTNLEEFNGWTNSVGGWFSFNTNNTPNVGCGPSIGLADTDGDGISDFYERELNLNPRTNDTDGNLVLDGDEDTDGDGLANNVEIDVYHTNPARADTDDDGLSDLEEIIRVTSPNHPMSVYSTDTNLNNQAARRSLDASTLPVGGIPIPHPERFLFTTNAGWTMEAWVYLNGDLNGDIISVDATNGNNLLRFGITNGSPFGQVTTNVLVGGPPISAVGVAPLLTQTWTHVGITWAPDDHTFRLYRDGVLLIAQQTSFRYTPGSNVNVYLGRGFTAGNLDEVRIWNRIREQNEVERWFNHLYPAPGYVGNTPRGTVPTAPTIQFYNDAFLLSDVGDYDRSVISTYDPTYEYGQPIVAYYRFDDGGAYIEDFAHMLDDNYYISGTVTTNTAAKLQGTDDADGDGLPEWWLDIYGLDRYLTNNIGPFHVLEITNSSDYPVSYASGWNTSPGTDGKQNRVYYNTQFQTNATGHIIVYFNVWQDNASDMFNSNNVQNDIYTGKGVYNNSGGTADDDRIYADAGIWFTPNGTPGANNVLYNDKNGNNKWDGGEDLWFDNGRTSGKYDLQNIIGIQYYRTFIAYNSVGVGDAWFENNRYITTKDTDVGPDGKFSAFTKYVYVENKPTTANMTLKLFNVTNFAVYVNGITYPFTPDTNGNNLVDSTGTNLVNLMKQGRNAIYLYTENGTFTLVHEIDFHYHSDFDRETTAMKFDMRLTADGSDIITRGDETVADPRAVWHGNAWSLYNNFLGGVRPLPDTDLIGQLHPDYGIPLDKDEDGLNNYYEFAVNTNPRDDDTDNDGIADSDEDYDGEGLINGQEQALGSDPTLKDTDDDGRTDAQESLQAAIDSLSPFTNRVLQVNGTSTNFAEFPAQQRFGLGTWTLEAFVRPAAGFGGNGTIIERSVQPGTDNYLLGLNGSVQPFARYGNVTLTASSPVVTDGTNWTHLAATYGSGALRIFVNGVQVASLQTNVTPVTSGGGPVVQRIGQNFNGQIDEVRIWKGARTAAQISANRSISLSGTETNLVMYYRFDDSTAVGGTSGFIPWDYGQIQDFVFLYRADWKQQWLHAGTLRGGAVMVVPSQSPVSGASDSDGDGLPDSWETFYGLNPLSGSGLDGTYGDPDNDGLSNVAEFQAGTDPKTFDTDGDGFSDYDGTNSLGQTFGEIYTDGDGMDDDWESQYPGVLSPLKFDAFDDPDSDGWNNFAEFSYNGPSATGTICRTSPTDPNSHPTPNVGFLIKYKGLNRTGNLHIHAFSDSAMNFSPTAALNFTPPSFGNQLSFSVSQFDSGYLRQGDTWFFAWWDNNGDGSWNEGEPSGIGQQQPYKIGAGGITNVVIGLSETLQGYGRFSWPATVSQVYTVTITRTTSSGAPVILTRSQLVGRNYFHEGDYQYANMFGLDAGNSDVPGYQWFVGAASGTFSFNWSTDLSKPLLNTPNGATLLYAQNAFAWSMDDKSVNVHLQIVSGSPSGPVIYDNLRVPAPYKDADGLYRYTLPIYAGDKLLPNGTYYWRVQSYNPRRQSLWSDFAPFTVNTLNNVPDVYSISGTISYFGKVTRGNVVVQAFTSKDGGAPAAQVTLVNSVSGAYRLSGLPAGTYYLRAFLDQNKNGKLDAFESYGTITDLSNVSCTFQPKAEVLPASQTAQDIVIRDRDVNNDNISDAFAYQFLTKQFQQTDFDGDGLGDLAVYYAASGTWFIRKSSDLSQQQTQFGWSSAVPVPGDYDGDGKRDIAVFHQASATWYLDQSSAGFRQVQFGWSETIPVPGDYDGDGKRDIAVYHPQSGTWYIFLSASQTLRVQQFGFAGVVPAPGDYDGDDKADFAVYHPATGNWYISPSSSQQLTVQQFGWAAAKAVPADYDGDGKTDLAVYNQSAGDWYFRYSTGGFAQINWGWFAARPVPSDYDSDGQADIAVYHPASGNWYIRYSAGGTATITWGWDQAVPVSSDAGLMDSRTP